MACWLVLRSLCSLWWTTQHTRNKMKQDFLFITAFIFPKRQRQYQCQRHPHRQTQDPDVEEALHHATKRLGELANATGVYVDAYMVLSLLEVGIGGLLQRLPRLLPVVQTTVSVIETCLLSRHKQKKIGAPFLSFRPSRRDGFMEFFCRYVPELDDRVTWHAPGSTNDCVRSLRVTAPR